MTRRIPLFVLTLTALILLAGSPAEAAGEPCGVGAGDACASGEFCKVPPGDCGTTGVVGVCTPRPQDCTAIYDPVCGCDGVTYGNECEADQAAAPIAYPGICSGQVCGGIAGIPCNNDEYCQFPDGTCDIADNQGVCRPIPQACPDVWLPVCGCDGQTYGNRCEAAAVGAQVDYEGECQPEFCDGFAGIVCQDPDDFCLHPDGNCLTFDASGICVPVPEVCPDVWLPVCGCDGQTYGNRCEALVAGVQVDQDGECPPQVCGGIAGIPCDEGEFCKLPAGECDVADLQGICQPIPQACPLFYDPVCGCDGVTYDNECDADQAGAQVDHPGECERVCGGIAGDPCDSDEYCQFPDGTCDIVDNQGVCRPIPQGCPDVWLPVCGCDGQTYGNRCEAAAVGAQVDYEGECQPQVCGGIAGIPCNDGEFCKLPDGLCDFADLQGVCLPIPDACPEIYDPVCGCDGQTYSNSCFADQAGVQIDHPGECAQVCGGIAGIPCDDGEFCKLPAGECDSADLQGVCTPIPLACPLYFDPVCGCDGVTYDNECDADRAGVQIDHPGPCEQVCGGFIGLDCDEGEYCVFPDGTCDIQDLLGVCRPIPQVCPDVWDPVCGCDGVTYGNRCEAAAAQAQIASEGECEQICGGFIGIPCDEGEYCMYPINTCNWADHYGTCVPIPDECPAVCDPVCGCDGVTYGNLCLAQQALASLSHRGECDPAGRLIYKVRFDSHERMRWQPAPAALSYNVYVEVHETPPPADAGECYLSGIEPAGAVMADNPDSGQVWLIQITGVFAGGEGPMGMSSDCSFRAPEFSCDQQ